MPRRTGPPKVRFSTPKTRPAAKPKAQVRINKEVGTKFENLVFQFLTEYLRERDIRGLVYKLPDGKKAGGKLLNQWIDIIVDSKEFGYIGIECKSINDSGLVDGKINLKKLSRKNAEYGHQFKKEHYFLENGGRYGLIAFEFTHKNIALFVSHQTIYDMMEKGVKNVTVDEIIKMGYTIAKDNPGSLKLFIKNKCFTVNDCDNGR